MAQKIGQILSVERPAGKGYVLVKFATDENEAYDLRKILLADATEEKLKELSAEYVKANSSFNLSKLKALEGKAFDEKGNEI